VVTAGYLEPNGSTTAFDGTLATGDAGFLLDGEVYVLGRLGDGLKIRGRWLFAEDLEALVRDAGAVRDPCVLTGTLGGRDAVTVLVTHRYPPEVRGAVGDAVRRTAGDHVHVSVRPMPQGWPLRTTSGKPRRREMWRRLAADGVHPAFPAAHRTPS
jgi:acyl-CoA synthetase (AMP-forming)/AMP-acid ligase II